MTDGVTVISQNWLVVSDLLERDSQKIAAHLPFKLCRYVDNDIVW